VAFNFMQSKRLRKTKNETEPFKLIVSLMGALLWVYSMDFGLGFSIG